MQQQNHLPDQNSIFQLFSERQLVGGCLDFLQQIFKDALCILSTYNFQSDSYQFDQMDLNNLIHFFISNYPEISNQFHLQDDYLRTLLYEIKYIRNQWAHQKTFNFRDVYRVYDSALLIMDILNFNKQNEIYQKINHIRDITLFQMQQKYSEQVMIVESEEFKHQIHANNNHNNQIFQNQDEQNNNKQFNILYTNSHIFS